MGKASREKPARLAEKLLQIRTALGLSQNGMLRRLEIADKGYRNYISDFENGVREPPLPVLLKYARAAGVPMEWLVDDDLDLPDVLPPPIEVDGIMPHHAAQACGEASLAEGGIMLRPVHAPLRLCGAAQQST